MTAESHQYANTRAAQMLDGALKAYTAVSPGGLRALAAKLGIKQATVLSQMANGRIAIPLDRAAELAVTLGIDAAEFCLAVVEQRAPAVYQALDLAMGISTWGAPSRLRELVKRIAAQKGILDEHIDVVGEVVATNHPRERWLAPIESSIGKVIRKRYPDGVPFNEIGPLTNDIEALLDT